MSLIAHYKLNDNAANTTVVDSTGSYDGTATANTSTLSAAGKINNAFNFAGSSSAKTPTGIIAVNSPWSVALWFNLASKTAGDSIISWGHGNDPPYGAWNMNWVSTMKLTWFDSGLTFRTIDSGVNPSIGQWVHAAITYDGTTLLFYLDGNQVGSYVNPDFRDRADTYNRIYVSGARGGTVNLLDGLTDDVRIATEVFTHQEILDTVRDGAGTESNPPNEALLGGPIIRQLLRSA